MRFQPQKGQTTIILLAVVFVLAFLLIGGLGDPTRHTILTPGDPNQIKVQQENGGLLGKFESLLGFGGNAPQLPKLTPTPILAPGATIAPSPIPTGTTEYPPRPIKFFWDEPTGTYTNPQVNGSNSQGSSLQMKNLNFSSMPAPQQTPTPIRSTPPIPVQLTPDPTLPHVCWGGQTQLPDGSCCVRDGQTSSSAPNCCPGVPTCQEAKDSGQAPQYACMSGDPNQWCYGKPVIYLYPKKKMNIDVELQIVGTLTESIPHYPKGGWKNITAFPDGKLMYQKTEYWELFYEINIPRMDPPKNGFIFAKKNLKRKLIGLTDALGFKKNEQQEFVEYWLPRLNTISKPYIFVSLFSQKAKDTVDHVEISPEPNVFIQYMFYFKPLEQPVRVEPLTLFAPQRKGFTAFEWGGVIDSD